MPYNTRRKSLSLPSLGIHLPNGSRSHRSPSAPKVPSTTDIQPPPSKKAKRSHDSESPSPVSASSEIERTKLKVEHKGRGSGPFEHTPPPSPADVTTGITKVDTSGINDDIVVAVIEQLEKTGNRPHLIKDLATVISNTNETVANSANAAALLSSRLSLYMKRPWTALAPCPIGKEMLPVHPRKVFFYLTTCPHQPLPEESDGMITPTTEPKRLTPSLSGASVDLDDVDEVLARERARISLSPEVDLSAPEFDEDNNDDFIDHSASASAGSFGGRNDLNRMHSHRSSHNHRSASPPLEGDEREFTQTASSVRERTSSEELALKLRQDLEKGDGSRESGSATPSGNQGAEMERDTSSGGQSTSQENGYDDYYSSHVGNDDQAHDLDTAAVTVLFGTSPSPSVSSEVSSLSSSGSATSEGETEITLKVPEKSTVSAELPLDLLNGNVDVTPTIGRGISSTRVLGLSDRSLAGTKRPISMLETTASEDDSPSNVNPRIVDSDMDTPFALAAAADPVMVEHFEADEKSTFGKPVMELTMSFDANMESWNDLRSPETIEVDELDEIFAGI